MPRNAILITVDCLRYDRLSAFGYDRPVSPTLDALAAEGALCDEAITTGPGTRESFPGILCSSYPLMYGGYAQLTDAREIISEVFRDRGFHTVGVNTNTQLHSRFGWDRGWDVYYDSERTSVHDPAINLDEGTETDSPTRTSAFLETTKSKVYSALDQDSIPYRIIESIYRRVGTRSPPHDSAATAVDRTFEFLEALPDGKPLFLWVHFMEPHSPYVPPEAYREEYLDESLSNGEIWRINDKVNSQEDEATDREVSIISDLYDASIAEVDEQIGRLIEGLREREYWDDAVTLICGDHGEAFREHGELAHGGKPYDELVRVPLIARLGREDISFPDGVISTLDIAPTLLDATLNEPDVPEKFHGISLCPVLRGEEPMPEDRAVFSQNASGGWREIDLSNRVTACRTDDWKFITSVREGESSELYHIADDRYEQNDIAAQHSDIVERMVERVDEHYLQDAYDLYDVVDAVEPDRLGDQLEALGYVE